MHPIPDFPNSLPAALSLSYYYDDTAINPVLAYCYWVRAKTATLISPMSYVGMGYAAIDPHGASGTADIAVRDLVFLPVNMTNNSHAGTVSFRVANLGPDALSASGVAFDFHMGTNADTMIWVGTAQSNLTPGVGGERLVILTPSAKRGLTARGDLSGVQTVKVTVRHLTAINDPVLSNNTALGVGLVTVKTNGPNSIRCGLNDYDGDGKADLAVLKVGQGVWSVVFSGMRYTQIAGMNTGLSNWQGAPGDYDGDGLNDIGLYNPASGYWWVWLSATRQAAGAQCGAMGFAAAPCDFDGDGKTDLLAYREADGYWLGLGSASDYAIYFGAWWCGAAPQPVPADYDGDGLADLMDYAESSGMWYGGLSSSGYQPMSGGYGGSGFVAVPADYDGDGSVDLGVYEYATGWWHVLMSNRATGPIGHGYREASGRMGAPDGGG